MLFATFRNKWSTKKTEGKGRKAHSTRFSQTQEANRSIMKNKMQVDPFE